MTSYQVDQRQWWVQKWLELLDSYRFKKRLERARNYAREGNVLTIEFEEAQVVALVQGSEPEPYQVDLSLDRFSDEDWQYVIETMSQKAIYSAQLLAGEMPDEIESVFVANGLSLFPFTLADVHSRCSCPDKANPCKHIGAVYYQLADRFSEDPFVLFQLRGKTKDEILAGLRQLRSQNQSGGEAESIELQEEIVNSTPPVAIDLNYFWHYEQPLDSDLVVIAPPLDQQNILDLLGRIPLASQDADAVEQFLQQAYQTIPNRAIATALSTVQKAESSKP